MWSITCETLTPRGAEEPDIDAGCLHEGLTFREAMDALRWARGCHIEADCSPLSIAHPPRWFTFYEAEHDMRTGEITNLELHIPRHITPASRMRVARLLGCYGAR